MNVYAALCNQPQPQVQSQVQVHHDTNPAVLCVPLANILRHLKVHHIDVWILDGAVEDEYLALLGTNFEEVSISTIVMKSTLVNQTLEVLKVDLLASKGYKCEMVSDGEGV